MQNRLYHLFMALLYILRCNNIFVEIYLVLFFISTYYVALLYICLVNNKHILYLFVVSHFLLFLISSAGFVFIWETCGTYVSDMCENRCHLILQGGIPWCICHIYHYYRLVHMCIVVLFHTEYFHLYLVGGKVLWWYS